MPCSASSLCTEKISIKLKWFHQKWIFDCTGMLVFIWLPSLMWHQWHVCFQKSIILGENIGIRTVLLFYLSLFSLSILQSIRAQRWKPRINYFFCPKTGLMSSPPSWHVASKHFSTRSDVNVEMLIINVFLLSFSQAFIRWSIFSDIVLRKSGYAYQI